MVTKLNVGQAVRLAHQDATNSQSVTIAGFTTTANTPSKLGWRRCLKDQFDEVSTSATTQKIVIYKP